MRALRARDALIIFLAEQILGDFAAANDEHTLPVAAAQPKAENPSNSRECSYGHPSNELLRLPPPTVLRS